VVALSLLDQKVPGSSHDGDKKFLTSGTKEKETELEMEMEEKEE